MNRDGARRLPCGTRRRRNGSLFQDQSERSPFKAPQKTPICATAKLHETLTHVNTDLFRALGIPPGLSSQDTLTLLRTWLFLNACLRHELEQLSIYRTLDFLPLRAFSKSPPPPDTSDTSPTLRKVINPRVVVSFSFAMGRGPSTRAVSQLTPSRRM